MLRKTKSAVGSLVADVSLGCSLGITGLSLLPRQVLQFLERFRIFAFDDRRGDVNDEGEKVSYRNAAQLRV
jgi:hypothetical protein